MVETVKPTRAMMEWSGSRVAEQVRGLYRELTKVSPIDCSPGHA